MIIRKGSVMRHKDEALLDSICKFAKEFVIDNSRSPTTKDIAEEFNVSRMTASRYLTELRERGRITYVDGAVHVDNLQAPDNVPVVGTIQCGEPQLEEENIIEYIPLPQKFVGRGEFFALYASGDSMIDAGINSGDLIFVRKQQTAEYGKIVVALVDNENTLKRLKYNPKTGTACLHPENKKYRDITDKPFEIQGVAVYILKKLE